MVLHVLLHVEISIGRPGRRRRGVVAAVGVARARDLGRQRGDGLEGPARTHWCAIGLSPCCMLRRPKVARESYVQCCLYMFTGQS